MTKGELIQALAGFSDHAPVVVFDQGAGGVVEIRSVEVLSEDAVANDFGCPVIAIFGGDE